MTEREKFDLRPRQVGEMRVLARCEDRVINDGRRIEQWLCRCHCGALQKRTRSNIIYAIRNHRNMSCYKCCVEYRGGLREIRREARHYVFMDWWKTYGDLYAPTDWQYLTAPSKLDSVPDVLVTESDDYSANKQQRMTDLYPINLGTDRVLQCVHCERYVHDCFGCVVCLSAVCVRCVKKERHIHQDDESETLVGVGRVLEVSRERTRQIEQKALCKMRRPYRARLLRDGDEIEISLPHSVRDDVRLVLKDGRSLPDQIPQERLDQILEGEPISVVEYAYIRAWLRAWGLR